MGAPFRWTSHSSLSGVMPGTPNFRLTSLTSLEAAAAGRSSPTIRDMEWPPARVSSPLGICLGTSAKSCLELGSRK